MLRVFANSVKALMRRECAVKIRARSLLEQNMLVLQLTSCDSEQWLHISHGNLSPWHAAIVPLKLETCSFAIARASANGHTAFVVDTDLVRCGVTNWWLAMEERDLSISSKVGLFTLTPSNAECIDFIPRAILVDKVVSAVEGTMWEGDAEYKQQLDVLKERERKTDKKKKRQRQPLGSGPASSSAHAVGDGDVTVELVDIAMPSVPEFVLPILDFD